MKEKIGKVFSIAEDNPMIDGLTISKQVYGGANQMTYFSLGKDTDISPELYSYYKLLIVAEGSLEIYGVSSKYLKTAESILTGTGQALGMRTNEGAIYTEIVIGKEDIMNENIKAGEVFKLKDLVPYQEDKIVNMDLVKNDKMKFVVMAFDEGTALSEHAAPGEALVFALDGQAVINYEGKDNLIKAGENFHFAKSGRHSIKATKKFKMALFLTLD
ncbi:MAG: cupin domain-containing protein [Finegoldia sp.]|nr:cupin domain-containing protein [Finegoldia sp.]